MPTLLNAVFTGRPNAGAGGAGTTTGTAGDLIDQIGGNLQTNAGLLRVKNYGLPWLGKNAFMPGSPAYDTNQTVSITVPAGMVDGDCIGALIKSSVLPAWGGSDFGGLGFSVLKASAFGGTTNVSIFAISNASRSEDYSTLGAFPITFTPNPANIHRYELVYTSGTPSSFTFNVYDVTAGGAPIQTLTGTCGPGGTHWSGVDYSYIFSNVGRVSVVNSGNPGYNAGVINDSKISILKIDTFPAIPPLVSNTPSLVSQSLGSNTINITSSGGDGSGITLTGYTALSNAGFVPGVGNILPAVVAGNVTDAHGDNPPVLPRGNAPLRFYKSGALQSGNQVYSSGWLMVESQQPATPSLTVDTVRADIRASRKLILGFGGDSLTGGPSDPTGLTIQGPTLACQNELSATYGIPAGNIVPLQIGAPGSMLIRDWQPTSAPYDVATYGANGYPNGYPALLVYFVNRLETLEAANPGSLVCANFALGTNDLQNFAGGNPNAAAILAAHNAIVTYIRTTRNKPNWQIVFHGIPWGSAGTLSTAEKATAYASWRTAILSNAWGTDVYLGTYEEWITVYKNPGLLADGVHYTNAGYTYRGQNQAKGLVLSALRAPNSPTVSTNINSFELILPADYFDSPAGTVDRTVVCVLKNTGNTTGIVTLSNIRRPSGSNANVAASGDWTLPAPGTQKLVNLIVSADTIARSETVVSFTAGFNGFFDSHSLTVYNATADANSPFAALPPGTGRTLAVPIRDRAWLCIGADADDGVRVNNAGDTPVLLNVAPYAPSIYVPADFTTGEILLPGETAVFTNLQLGGDAKLFAIASRVVYNPIQWQPGRNSSRLIVTRGA